MGSKSDIIENKDIGNVGKIVAKNWNCREYEKFFYDNNHLPPLSVKVIFSLQRCYGLPKQCHYKPI